ncbi:MAG: hypothetical protein ACOCO9_00630 [Segatella copri]
MAKNYTFNEAVKIIAKGTDLEAITDIGRRYPVLAHKIAVVTAKAGEEFVDLMGYMPDYLTANKVNAAIKAGITESGSDDEDAEGTEAEATTEDATEATAQWDESMSAKQLWDILGKAGKRKLAKSTKKADLIEACKQAFGAATEAEAEDAEAEDDAAEANPYEGKSAMELFKECKARKIKAVPKKPAKFYADLLIKDDAAKVKATEAESKEDDDWGDKEAEASKKEDKKAAPKGGKAKAAKKAEAESEDDEDWDI